MGQDLGKACGSVQGTAWVKFRAWVSGWGRACAMVWSGNGLVFGVGHELVFEVGHRLEFGVGHGLGFGLDHGFG